MRQPLSDLWQRHALLPHPRQQVLGSGRSVRALAVRCALAWANRYEPVPVSMISPAEVGLSMMAA
jgi:hypothetical protein